MIRVAVCGASGRMGQMLIGAVLAAPDCCLGAALDRAGSPAIGQTAAPQVLVGSDVATALAHSDVLIDFTRPEATLQHLKACTEAGVAMVIGTTGFDEVGKTAIAQSAKRIPIVFAPNMGVGVNVTLKLLELAAKALQTGYDVEIVEAHHRHKVDAPSGTAIKMGEVIAHAQGKQLADCAVYAREGLTGEREGGTIGFATMRGGDVVGDHTVLFLGEGERIEIAHKSTSRNGYAQGSLRAARYLQGKPAGLYDMFDVLGLKNLSV